MKILVLNGEPVAGPAGMDGALRKAMERGREGGHEVRELTLREMKVAHCIGCFRCWIKTPGVCIFTDDQVEIIKKYVAADLVIMASPLIMGFTSSLLKKSCDRIIPILLPYIDGSSGECRHFLRYAPPPRLGVWYAEEEDTDQRDLEITSSLWRRLARNAGTSLVFFTSVHDPAMEVWA